MSEPIAIVGTSCRFPGGVTSPSKLWDLLQNPKDVLSEFPPERLSLSSFHNKNGEHHGSTDVQNKSYLLSEDCRHFDASFFSINPMEADGMDPQQRILLETVYEAIESAGYTLQQMRGSLTSVHVGLMTADWSDIQYRDTEVLPQYNATGTARSILSNRISYFFDLKGASMTIDTACSSSLVALHQAVQGIRNGEADAAIVAGANLLLDPAMYIAESKLHMLSPDSRCRMWDKSANGYARGEGFAAVVVKSLRQALADGDHIECIIKETGVNSDGRTKGITMPSPTAQTALIRRTYRSAGLDPEKDGCHYFECHGTGTAAGDPVEARAIRDAFFPDKTEKSGSAKTADNRDKLRVGSIKTIIGHLEGCAGLAGVLKASLAIQNQVIPPNLHFQELNPAVAPFYDSLEIVTKATPWPEVSNGPRRASVNSFGFGGTNAHVILESYEENQTEKLIRNRQESVSNKFVGPLSVSAHTESSLQSQVRKLRQYLATQGTENSEELASFLYHRRSHLSVKTYFTGATPKSLFENMDNWIDKASTSGSLANVGLAIQARGTSDDPGLLGIFTGQGAQWATMGRSLISCCRVFRESIEQCEQSLAELGADAPAWSLKEELMADEGNSRLAEAALSQPLCTAVQVGLVNLASSAGIKFAATVGHSSGEIAATYTAGMLSLRDAIRIAYYRGLFAKLAKGLEDRRGGMMAVGVTADDAMDFCSKPEFVNRIVLAASNARTSVTLSGDLEAIEEAKQYFDSEKTFARQLKVDTAYHSFHMLPCSQPYLDALSRCGVTVSPPREDCTWISSVSGDTSIVDDEDYGLLQGQYWVDNMVKPVLFLDAVECALWAAGPYDLAIEVGPHTALKGPSTQVFKAAAGSPLPYTGLMLRGINEVAAFSTAVGDVWSNLGSSSIDFDGYRQAFDDMPLQYRVFKDVPSYAWDHGRIHWKESRISRKYRLGQHKPHELLGRRVPDDSEYEMRWRNVLRLSELPWVRGHVFQGQVLLPAASYVAMALEAARAAASRHNVRMIEVSDLFISRPTLINEDAAGVELVFTLRSSTPISAKSAESRDGFKAEFAAYVCTDEATGSLEPTCRGQLQIHHGDQLEEELSSVPQCSATLSPIEIDRFYHDMRQLGLHYQGSFKAMDNIARCLDYATASASWDKSDIDEDYIIHPSCLDVAFQSMFAAYSSPSSDDLWAPYLPVGIRRLIVDPHRTRQRESHGKVHINMVTAITSSSSSNLEGDIHISIGGSTATGIQVEGMTLKSISAPTAANDRQLFTRIAWDAELFAGPIRNDKKDLDEDEFLDVIERVALYYFRVAVSKSDIDNAPGAPWFSKLFLDAAQHHLNLTTNDQHPSAKREWLQDSPAIISKIMGRYSQRIDLILMKAIGENLVSIVRGETRLWDVMMRDNMLDDFYMEGFGFRILNEHIAKVVSQISHKFPKAKFLEIGAGTGGTTKKVLDKIGKAYSSYTYTDLSAGFFDKATAKFSEHKDKMLFKVLDIEKPIEEQGFEPESYDVIIAANVLHATSKLKRTIQHVRTLLRPGGYLVMMEVTGDLLRMPFIMGGFEGWWLGADEGRKLGPGISTTEWDRLLRDTGFSGVDTAVRDKENALRHSFSTLVTQAVDAQIEVLRDPLLHLDAIPTTGNLLIVGGQKSQILDSIKELFSTWKGPISAVESLDRLNKSHLSTFKSIICLTETDKPLFSELMIPERLAKMQQLFSSASNVQWITRGRRWQSPESNMMTGIGRVLLNELPSLNFQLVDIDDMSKSVAKTVAEAFLRSMISGIPSYSSKNMLWTAEPELVVEDGRILIPRVIFHDALNDRHNAIRRPITKQVDLSHTCLELFKQRDSIELREVGPLTQMHIPGRHTRLVIEYSVALPPSGQDTYYVCYGLVHDTNQRALTMSKYNRSVVDVLPEDLVAFPQTARADANIVQAVANQLVARDLASRVSDDGTVLIHEPWETLAIAIAQSQYWDDHRCVFATSLASSVEDDWISVSKYATYHNIDNSLPRDIKTVIDFSTSGYPKTKKLAAATCLSPGFQPFARGDGALIGFNDWLKEAYQEAIACTQQTLYPALTCMTPFSEAPGKPTSAPLGVVAWDKSKPAETRIAPLDYSRLFSVEKTYFMIGMTGDLGRSICKWMVSQGARFIALASRGGQVDSAWRRAMEKEGVVIKVFKMDVTSRRSVLAAYNAMRKEMPPVAGVFNAAMVLTDKVFTNMDVESLNQTLKPKVDGSKLLDELFSDKTLDFFVFFSSATSIVGNGGQSNYSAANQFMTSLAANRRARGLAGSVIHIGLVVDVGYTARSGRRLEDYLRQLFYLPLSERDIHHLIGEAVLASPPDSGEEHDIIMGLEPYLDNGQSNQRRPPWYGNPRFSHLILESKEQGGQAGNEEESLHVRQHLAAAKSQADAAKVLQKSFATKLESLLRLDLGTVSGNVTLLDLGCDSLLAVEIRTWFLHEIQVDVPVLKMLSGDTVAEICNDAVGKFLAALPEGKELPAGEKSATPIKPGQDGEKTGSSGSVSGEDDKYSECIQSPYTAGTSSFGASLQPSGTEDDSDSSSSVNSDRVQEFSLAVEDSRDNETNVKTNPDVAQMSYAQSRLWFLAGYLEDPRAYNITVSYDLAGDLDTDRFRSALSAVIARHEILRTRFYNDGETGEPMQEVLGSTIATFKHVRSPDAEAVQDEFSQLQNQEWDLTEGRTFRATLVSRAPDMHTAIFGYHHIVMDGVSWTIFLRDLKLAYEGRLAGPSPKQYWQFSTEQKKAAASRDFDSELEFWKRQHAQPLAALPLLPIAHANGRKPLTRYDNDMVTQTIGHELVAKIKNTSRSLGITPFHFYLTTLEVLLHQFLKAEDVCIGLADANRVDETADTVGFFLNLLPVRFKVNHKAKFAALARQTATDVVAALKRSRVPFDLVLQNLKAARSSSHSPLFQVVLNYRQGELMKAQVGECEMTFNRVDEAKNPYDLCFAITNNPGDGTCFLQIMSQSYLYPSEACAILMRAYIGLLERMSSNPTSAISDVRLYDEADVKRALSLGDGPRVNYSWPNTLVAKFREVSKTYADEIAIKDMSGPSTYSQLSQRINNIATVIAKAKLPNQSHIAVLCQQSANLVASMLAILATGHVYVPLDLSLPPARHAAILANCQPRLILCDKETAGAVQRLSQDISIGNISALTADAKDKIPDRGSVDSPAVLLHTSGSTGVPKGIILTQANFINHLALKTHELGIGRETVLQQSSFGFDMSIIQTFCALANGGTLIIAPQPARGDPIEIAALMRKEHVTFTIATPSEYLMLLRNGRQDLEQCRSWRRACLGGEVVTNQLIREFASLDNKHLRITNCYGPTEITAAATFQSISLDPVNAKDLVSVGKPLPNYSVYILDEHSGTPLPIGYPGEICISGASVALAYLKLPEQTKAKFVHNPFASPVDIANGWSRMYKTGDKGRLLADGSLVFMGRKSGDTQVKLRGLRIELDEVANALLKARPELFMEAVVSVRGDPQFLVAHVLFKQGQSIDPSEIRSIARDLPLPEYMRPGIVIAVDSLPMNSNGKVDRKAVEALPLPDLQQQQHSIPEHERLTLDEGQVSLLWKEVLPLAEVQVGPRADFFMVGGNSLLLVALQRAIKDVLNVSVSITDLYQAPTVREMAALVSAKKYQQEPEELIDWDHETSVPEDIRLSGPGSRGLPTHTKAKNREILLTGSYTFLGSEIVQSLLKDATVHKIHCIAVPVKKQGALPTSSKLVAYNGDLRDSNLGLSSAQYAQLEEAVDVIIHAGSIGHCLNSYKSIRIPNVESTVMLARMALRRRLPLHYVSSNRVVLLSGHSVVLPVSVSKHLPPQDGTEGFTASKWASERFLEDVAGESGLQVYVHRPCAVTGDEAPSDDALNALLRFSRLLGAVPRFDNFGGFFDFQEVQTVGNAIVKTALASINESQRPPAAIPTVKSADSPDTPCLRFCHHTSGVKVPVDQFSQHLGRIYNRPFEVLEIKEWLKRARPEGLDMVISSFLEAMVEKKDTITFPYLGDDLGGD